MDSTLALIHAISILEHWMSELTPFSKKTFPDIIWPAKSDQQESKFGRQLRCYASLPWYRFIVITYHFIDRLVCSTTFSNIGALVGKIFFSLFCHLRKKLQYFGNSHLSTRVEFDVTSLTILMQHYFQFSNYLSLSCLSYLV